MAIENAKSFGLDVYKNISDIPDEWADIIISNHALEHVESPLCILKELYKKLKSQGIIIFYVPCESFLVKYNKNDINRHLYTWSPLNIGNLFNEAGFTVTESSVYIHRWPPNYRSIANFFGRKIFNILCILYGLCSFKYTQVKIVAFKQSI